LNSRLGHASIRVVEKIISKNNLFSSQKCVDQSVCDAYQQAKSHQLPYSWSISTSKFPLVLDCSDVWGPAPESLERKKYYVFLLVILANLPGFICTNLNLTCFRNFKNSRLFLKEYFIARFLLFKQIGEVNIKSSIPSAHHVSCPHTHQQNGFAERKHHHIVETGLFLLAHASLPLKF
jgi:hypothetical protein